MLGFLFGITAGFRLLTVASGKATTHKQLMGNGSKDADSNEDANHLPWTGIWQGCRSGEYFWCHWIALV